MLVCKFRNQLKFQTTVKMKIQNVYLKKVLKEHNPCLDSFSLHLIER